MIPCITYLFDHLIFQTIGIRINVTIEQSKKKLIKINWFSEINKKEGSYLKGAPHLEQKAPVLSKISAPQEEQ